MSANTITTAVNSFVMSNCNYCPLVWNFTTIKSNKKIEKIQERALLLSNEHNLTYQELLKNAGKCTMELCRFKYLCIEIYKTINNLNPSYMRDIFKKIRTDPQNDSEQIFLLQNTIKYILEQKVCAYKDRIFGMSYRKK